MKKKTISYFFKSIFLTTIFIGGVFSAPQVFAENNSLSESNLKSLETAAQEDSIKTIDLQLYQANLAVADSSETERNTAFATSLKKVLIQVSGNPQVAQLSLIQAALKQPANFVEQFSYIHGGHLFLNIHFNIEAINSLLKKAQQPILDQQRSPVIIWLIAHESDKNSDKSHLIGNEPDAPSEEKWIKTLQESAQTIGLPIALPFADLDDLSTLSVKNLWATTPKEFQDASERYGADNILVIKMDTTQTKSCSIQYSLLSVTDENSNWKESAPTCEASLEKGMTQTLKYLLKPQAKKAEIASETATEPVKATQTIHVLVSHIQSAEDYQQVLHDLQNQPSVIDVSIDKVTPHEIIYILHIKDNMTEFVNSLSQYSELKLIEKNTANNSLTYQFMGSASANIWGETQ